MFNRRTLKRLERQGPRPCPECRLPPDEPGSIVLKYDGTPAEDFFPDDPGECCERCGHPLWCVVNLVHDEGGEGVSVE